MLRFLHSSFEEEIKCAICGKTSVLVSKVLGICGDCIRNGPEEAQPYIKTAHHHSRARFDLPPEPPQTDSKVKCKLCVNSCAISENDLGFCGLRVNQNGRLKHLPVLIIKVFSNIITIHYQLTVLVIGYALVVLVRVIRNFLIPIKNPNTGIRIWQSFMVPVPSIVYIVRTGTIAI